MKPITTILIFLLFGISGSSLAQAPPTVNGELTICAGSTTTLTASGESGATFAWYEVASGGTAVANTAIFTTPTLSATRDYYVDQTTGAGTSARQQVTITVSMIPNPLQPINIAAASTEICEGGNTTLSAAVDAMNHQVVYWYDSPTGGNLLGITPNGADLAVTPTDTTTYYAQSDVEIFTQTFNYTGAMQTFTVPTGVTQISVNAYGGRGGWGNYKRPGYGGQVQTTMSVTPGQVLNLYVGNRGEGYNEPNNYNAKAGGWNGGGNAQGHSIGGGGGATDIRIGGTALTDRVLVAGGGGGSGGSSCNGYGNQTGAGGGGLIGATGGTCNYPGATPGAGGGTQSAGGARTCRYIYCGSVGSLGQGGTGGPNDGGHYGGGGGGGYYGGGGAGSGADGGGGSSYTNPNFCTNVIHNQDVRNGAGQLVISYSLAASCASTTRVPLTVNVNEVPTISVSSDTAICNGNSVTLTASGADTYTWMPGNLTGASISVSPNTTTIYTVTGTLNAGGCSSTATTTVTISQVIASADVTICEGESTTLTASGSNTYAWSPGGLSGASVTVSPLVTTEYEVIGTEVNGCTTKDTVVVTVNAVPVLTADADTIIEYGASVDLTASGADSYSWTPGGGTTATITVSPGIHTTYTVTGTYNATGCTSSEDIIISVIAPIRITGNQRVCEGESVTLNAVGTSGATFNWYDAPTGGNLLSSTATYTSPVLNVAVSYYIEQTLGTYTSNRIPVDVYVNGEPSPMEPTNVQASPTELCIGESTDLTAEVDAPNHQRVYWYDAPTGGTLLGVTDSAEAFTISPTDTTTYYAQSEVEEIIETFNYTGAVQTFTVPAGVTNIAINAYGGRGGWGNYKRPGYGGQVQATLNVVPGETLNIYVGGQAQGYNEPNNYNAKVGGWNGGGNAQGHSIGGGGGATDIRINGTSLAERVLVAGGGGGSGGSSCGGYGNTTGGGGGGLTGANGGHCNSSSSSRAGRGGSQTAGGARGCHNGFCGGTGTVAQGGVGCPSWGGSYGGGGGGGYYGGGGGGPNADGGGGSSYTDPALFSNVIHTQDAKNGPGQLIITYSLAESCGSDTRIPVTVNVNPEPSITVSPDTAICNGNTVTLTASGADTYTWMPDNLTGASISVTPNTTTTYTVTGTLTAGGCSSTATTTVTISQVLASADVAICEGEATTLTASGSNTYAWSPGGLTGTSITLSPLVTTEYEVIGTEINGCTTKDTVVVTVNPVPVLTLSPDTTIEFGASATLTASGADSYSWSPGGETTSTITVSPNDLTTYTVTGTYDATGCTTSADIIITVISPLLISGERNICQGETVTLTASGLSGATFNWYDAATGGNLLNSAATYTSPVLNASISYYIDQTVGAYTSAREQVDILVNTSPSPMMPGNIMATPATICEGESADLTAEVDRPNHQKVNWYDAPTGGTLLAVTDSAEAFTVSPTDTTTYYAQSEVEEIVQTFNYTGSLQTFTVPAGVTSVEVNAYGGRGGWGNYKRPGYGGQVQATLNVVPGETLNIYVGGQAQGYGEPGGYGTRAGGWNGGGNAQSYSIGGGGGATDIRINGTSLAERILVAGGGGGSGGSSCSGYGNTTGGGGGGLTGAYGGQCNAAGSNQGGRGGTQSGGGARGCKNGYCGGNGGLGQGGVGAPSWGGNYGGGGGGGYYGGGGGAPNADGGGGSSYTDPNLCTNITHTQDAKNGPGQLIITYTLAKSCASETRVPVTVNVDPQANLITTETIQSCPGANIEMIATGADQYLWTPGNLTGDTVQVSPTVSTTYTLIGSMNTGTCNDTSIITITIDTVSATVDLDTICNGSLATLTATGASTYLWTPGNLSGASQTISPTATTTYVVAGTNANACTTYNSVTIVVVPNNFDMATTPDTAVLMNTKARLTTSGASSVIWSTGATTNSIEFLAVANGTYTVTGFDNFGCEDVDVINVTVEDMPEITGTTIILKGSSTILTASPPSAFRGDGSSDTKNRNSFMPTTYAWYDAPTGGSLLGSSETYTTPPLDTNAVYFVEMDDGSGVSMRKCITVNVIDAESTIVSAEQDSICPSSSTNLSGNLENPGVINWYDAPTGGNLLGSSNRGEDFSINPSSTATYYGQGETEEYTQTFDYTGAVQTFTVPAGVTSISVNAYGGAGGNARYTTGGRGGQIQATINVTPGEVLNLYVGGQGANNSGSGTRPGGWNGGGSGGSGYSSGGGGASDIRINGTSTIDRILVAGGGGGGKASSCSTGAPGTGGNISAASGGFCYSGNAAGGGSQTGGGGRGCYGSSYCGTSGGFANAGNGYRYSGTTGGGGGGGGWYGGGGGHLYGNGGGGSSYANIERCANIVHTAGTKTGNGQIVLTYSLDDMAPSVDSVTIDVGDYEDPVPDVANLAAATGEGSVTVAAPTGIDNCLGAMSATTTDPTFYDTPGAYMIEWDYDDGSGNFISQQQQVIVSAVLPVELFSFTGRKNGKTVLLNWATANELNSKGFEVQRSADAINWEPLDFINSSGNSDISRQYKYVDVDPMTGSNYYRLLLRDLDNSFEYSDIVQVQFDFGETGIRAFPNPTSTGRFTVLISDPSFNLEAAHLTVFDQLGRQVLEKSIEDVRVELSTETLAGGTYTIRVDSGNRSWQARVIVIRD